MGMQIIGKVSAFIFMLLCGVSSCFSKNCLKGGIKIFLFGMLLTVVTHLIDLVLNTRLAINFGILHLLGLSLVLWYFLKRLPNLAVLVLSAVILFCSFFVSSIHLPYLFPFGITDSSFYSSDYYPLIPYSAIVLIGAVLGRVLYQKKESLFRFSLPDNLLSFIGRHSLVFYLFHQVVILAFLYLLFPQQGWSK